MGNRTGHKILHFPLVKILIAIIVVVGLYIASQFLFDWLFNVMGLPIQLRYLGISVISSGIAIWAYLALFKVYEKRSVGELNLLGLSKFLLKGILLGAVLQSLTILVMYFAGAYDVLGINPIIQILPGLAMAFSSAIFEEILMRGIIYRITEEKLGSVIALVISALIFGGLHLGNPNSTLFLALGLAIQAGLLLGVAYIYSRSLWFPIGIHFAWNFLQSGIFGAAVSGNATRQSLLSAEIVGNELITGGEFGPEGSVQATLICLIATVTLLVLCYRKGRFIRPFWSKSI